MGNKSATGARKYEMFDFENHKFVTPCKAIIKESDVAKFTNSADCKDLLKFINN